ncbi:FAD-dependent oxidoreductase [Galbitalea soli]|uniref:Oxidoreductase n=1 Tax=Galbitalea soli TaxID=1268042 RepID=A0A7C9TSQ3_9MICO|nr:oxidoreductase [Galbitalea soli]NEM92241.1 oxidoreductase [Galbitalea soli]NYJ31805.1 ferredoxin-NADP reductase [Galbitalea soli]
MTRWLDELTGRVTMYRLILLCLAGILIEAVLVALTGQIAVPPLAILAVTATALVVTYLSNRLFAAIVRVRPHSESSLITALILALLFYPALDPVTLGGVALASIVASASKYLLAVRGRHVFNPAATGAAVVALVLPSATPTWWVATPWLLPLVVIGGLVILHRTRHLALGGVFVLVATVGTVVILVQTGMTALPALTTALGSFPIVFFAGFMLSEPLTLPPKRWQQLAVAAVVGVLFAAQFHVGVFVWSYALALLVGNALSFAVGQRRGIRLVLLGRKPLGGEAWEFSFRPIRPLRFEAGQYLELNLPHRGADVRGVRRTFSIASAPTDTGIVSIGLRVYERTSSFKRALMQLEPGATISATSVGGDFVLPADPAAPLLFVASGIGITPYVSQLRELAATGEKRDLVLVWANSSADDLPYGDALAAAGHRVLLVAPHPPAVLPAHWEYLGRGGLTAELLTRAVPDAASRHAFLSGPPALVHALRPALRRAGVRRVRTDYFSGY